MRRMHGANVGFLLAVALSAAACGKGDEAATATPTATTTPTAATKATATATATATAAATGSAAAESPAEANEAARNLRRHHRHHHHGGVAMFIDMAIDTLGLPAEKKAQVEKIQAELHAKMAPSREAAHNVLTILADGAAAGKIDDKKLDAAIAKQEAESGKVHGATIEALDKLHDALSPAERAALVDKVKAHAEVWKKVNQEEEHGSKDKESHLGRLTEELSLTPEQVEKISAALKKDAPPKPDAAKIDAHIKAFEAAFLAEKFDAKALTTANDANTHISKIGAARLARFYKIVIPLLTPEQRTKLAAQLRERLTDPHAVK
jgi:Spy/CpxP family protein refolding chaperone